MKKKGILHPELAHLAASLGHTDYLVIADKGYPIPNHVERINLGYTNNQPTVLQVLEPLVEEISIDRIIVTEEMEEISPNRLEELKNRYPHILFEKISHHEMKELTNHAKGAVKTGDACPYANLIIVSG
jgi:D-ribose pyranase